MGDRLAVLHRGVVQQVGSPMEVYAQPANMVVARLLGSPPMNLAPCAFCRPDCIEVGEGVFRVTLARGQRIEPRGSVQSDDLVLGVRAENVRLSREALPGARPVVADVVQSLGSEDIVSVTVGDAVWKVRAACELRAREGDAFYLGVDPARVHLFYGRTSDVAVEVQA